MKTQVVFPLSINAISNGENETERAQKLNNGLSN